MLAFIGEIGNEISEPLTGTDAGAAALPSFTLYSDAACTTKVADCIYDRAAGEVTLPSLEALKDTDNDSGVEYYLKETGSNYKEHNKVYKLTWKKGNIFKFPKEFKATTTEDETTHEVVTSYALLNNPLPVNLKLTALKTFAGGTLLADTFQFELKQVDNPNGTSAAPQMLLPMGKTVTNDAAGNVIFFTGTDKLEFTKAGTYTFTIQENKNYRNTGVPANYYDIVTYDDKVRTITVVVEKDKDGNGLVATVTGGDLQEPIIATTTSTNSVGENGIVTANPIEVEGAKIENTNTPTVNEDGNNEQNTDNTTDSTIGNSTSVKTGDSTLFYCYIALMFLTLTAICMLLRRKGVWK